MINNFRKKIVLRIWIEFSVFLLRLLLNFRIIDFFPKLRLIISLIYWLFRRFLAVGLP
jgi:hypothetical protein